MIITSKRNLDLRFHETPILSRLDSAEGPERY